MALIQAQTEPPFPPTGQWYTYANGDDILALQLEGDVLWASTRAGGVVRWDTTSGAYVQFLKPQDGLAGNVVYDIAIDPNGYKWFATDHGLSVLADQGTADKADDIWYSYTQQSTAGQLPSNHVTAVAVDEAGYVWVGSSQYWDLGAEAYVGGGLSKLDTRGTLDPGDDVWLHTYTLENTLTVQQGDLILGLASDNVVDILPVPGDPSTGSGQGRVWVATRQHWFYEPPDENIPGQWVLTHGGLSRLDHAGTTDPEDDVWKTWNCEDDSLFGCVVTQLQMDRSGYVWAAMRGRGVLTFHYDAASLRPDRDRFTTADGLESNFVDAIAFGPPDDPDWQNTVWFSTYHSITGRGYGVSVLDHNGTLGNRSDDTWNARNPVEGEPITSANGLAGDRVRAMRAGAGKVWMGTSALYGIAHGISPFDLTKRAPDDPLTTAAAGLANNYITDLAFGQPDTRWESQIWVATGHRRQRRYGQGVLRLDTQRTLDPSDDTWEQYTRESTDDDGVPPWTGLASNNVIAVAVAGDRVWLGAREATWDASKREFTDGGLSVFDGEQWTTRTVENTGGDSSGLRSNRVSALAIGCGGEVWVGLGSLEDSRGDGVDILDVGGDVHDLETDTWWDPFGFSTIPSDLITDMAPDCDRGRLWVAGAPHFTGSRSQGGGVGQYDYASETWSTYSAPPLQSFAAGDITGEAYSIAVGPNGDVWVGTWGTVSMTSGDVIGDWPYVPAVVNWYRGGSWSNQVFAHDGWVSSVAVDAAGVVWAGTSRGGMDTDLDGQPEDGEVRRAIGGIKLTVDGSAWESWSPANPSTALRQAQDDSSGQRSPLASDDIEVVAVAPDGDVWIGTSGWGLMRFHPGLPAEPTPTSTATPPTPDPSPTATPTDTPTSTVTPEPTRTATPDGSSPHRVYLPLVARDWTSRLAATGTATPPATSPQFTCGGWCQAGSSPGMGRQTVSSDLPVEDWRAYINDMPIGVLDEETPTYAVVEAPTGYHVRVQALFQGQWLVACESDVECQ